MGVACEGPAMTILKRVVAGVAVVVTALALVVATPAVEEAEALSGSDFYPGYIITDARFYDGAAMSQVEIQRFLDARVPNCVGANGLTCLRYAQFDTFDRAPSSRCGAYPGATGEFAATVIAKVAQICGINPQVLLVMLQKEQGLITATSPTERQYRVAMGYACPDTAPCDAQFFGFFNQVYKAAWQLRQYGVNPSSWRYRIGNVAIQFHPNAACGSTVVNIANAATAALYNYTPYQPNAAALANLGGTGDSCSSYGNRNFWVHFSNWFGPPTGPNGRPYLLAEYARQGGASGPLGPPESDVLVIPENDGGLGQAYANGSIYWTWTGGAHTMPAGTIRDHYFSQGGAAGWMGWPISGHAQVAANGGGTAQVFTVGSLFASASGIHLVRGAVRDGYFLQGGATGPLGWPNAEAQCEDSVCSQTFTGGTVYAHPTHGAFPVEAGVDGPYRAAGGAGGDWGWPRSALQQLTVGGGGWAQAFSAGSVYSRDRATFYLVNGVIRDLYFTKNGAAGELGYPLGDAQCDADRCVQRFERGAIIEEGGVARFGDPEIEATYAAEGGSAGALGPAVTGPLYLAGNGGGFAQAYQRGSIYRQAASTTAYAVSGSMLTGYFSVGGATGPLGWPTSAVSCASTTCTQSFSLGRVVSSPAGAFPVAGAFALAYEAAGGVAGSWGAPTTGLLSIRSNGGGTAQVFTGGSVYARDGRAPFLVTGATRDHYFSLGGAAGALGWPASALSCADGVCSQTFDGGVVVTGAGFARVFTPAFLAAWTASAGAWGVPTSDTAAISGNGGGFGQAFASASAYARTGGAVYAVSGRIRDAYFSRGGATGSLGWPTSDPVCTGGTCTQTFQFGRITDDGVRAEVG